MFGNEPYILFALGIGIITGLIVSYYAYDYYEIPIILFVLSTISAAIFYDNAPVWINEEIESGIGSYLRAGSLIFSGIVGLVHFTKKSFVNNFRIPIHIIVIIIFAIFSMASAGYSIDSKSTIIRSTLLISVVLFVLGLNSWLDSEKKFKRLLNILFYVSTIIIIFNVISMLAIPARTWWWKTPSRFLGLFSHPNGLGGFLAVSFPIIIWKYYNSNYREQIFSVGILLINMGLILSTGSRTSLIMITITSIIWLFYYREWVKLAVLGSILIFGIIFISQIGFSSYNRDEGSKLTDLTEREFIWEGASVFIREKPLIGYGYAVEGKIFANQLLFDMEEQYFNANSQQPLHNGYLSIFIGGGSIGLGLWIIAIGSSLYLSFKSKFTSFKIYAIASILPILVANVVESAITGYLSSTDIYFWLAWAVGGKVWIINFRKETISATPENIHKEINYAK